MNAYETLAGSYDELTCDVDYPGLLQYLHRVLDYLGSKPETVLDLACGTGSMSVLLAREGYRVVGADLSEDMLTVAYDKALSGCPENRPFFIHQAMQRLKLPQPVDLVLCLLDSLNYLTRPEDAAETIRRVYDSLAPGGIFVFDINTTEKFRAMHDQVWLDETDDSYCVWRTQFDEDTRICSYGVDLFRRRGGLWQRSFEEHLEYAYTHAQLTAMLRNAGFGSISCFADRRLNSPQPGDQRVFYAAKRTEAPCTTN